MDEGQFYPDLGAFADRVAGEGKTVIVAALDGDFLRNPFGDVYVSNNHVTMAARTSLAWSLARAPLRLAGWLSVGCVPPRFGWLVVCCWPGADVFRCLFVHFVVVVVAQMQAHPQGGGGDEDHRGVHVLRLQRIVLEAHQR